MDECYPSFCKRKAWACSLGILLLQLPRAVFLVWKTWYHFLGVSQQLADYWIFLTMHLLSRLEEIQIQPNKAEIIFTHCDSGKIWGR